MGKANFIDRRYSRSDVNQNYGLNRESKQGTSTYANTPPGKVNTLTPTDKFLRTDGGKLHSPIGFDKKTIVIDGSNAIDIAQGGGNFVPRIVLDGTTSTTLDTISNPLFEGQKIYLQAWGTGTITIGVAGNIQTAMSLTANHIMELIYDFDVGKWIMPEDNVGSGGGSGEVFTWTADHSSGGNDLVMGLGDITFGTGGTTKFNASDALFLLNVNSTEIMRATNSLWQVATSFYPKTDSTYTLGTSSRYWSHGYIDQITMTGGGLNNPGFIYQNANDRHYFGSGGNYIMQNSSNGDLEFRTNSTSVDHSFFVGSMRMNINKDTIRMRNPIDMSANKILDVTYIQSDTSVGFTENYIDMGSSVSPVIISSSNNMQFQDGAGAAMLLNQSSGALEMTHHFRVLTGFDDTYDIGRSGTTFKKIYTGRSFVIRDYFAPGTAPADISGNGQLFIRDNGSGKMQLRVKFGSTTSQEIITET